jgi:hypothetical protein
MIYSVALGGEMSVGILMAILTGVMFILMGNYLPKATRNRYFGIKIKWTLDNDENWAATHRFAGKVWVITGIVTLIGAFLPEKAAVILLIAASIPAIIIPILYSYYFHKKQLADGTATKEDYSSYAKSNFDKKSVIVVSVIGSVVLIGVILLMFIGSLTFTVGDEALEIDTTYGGGMTLDYSDIDSIEYVKTAVPGMRVSGFASSKLLYGWFKNDELGNYTRYTYTKSEANIIIRAGDDIIVIADETAELTKSLYDSLLDKIN